jgi:hypothetical protein
MGLTGTGIYGVLFACRRRNTQNRILSAFRKSASKIRQRIRAYFLFFALERMRLLFYVLPVPVLLAIQTFVAAKRELEMGRRAGKAVAVFLRSLCPLWDCKVLRAPVFVFHFPV